MFAFNYTQENDAIRPIYKLKDHLLEENGMIKFGIFNDDLSKFIVTQEDQTLFVDINKEFDNEVDLDDQEQISDIHNIIAYEDKFLILANKRRHRVGLYLLEVDINNPKNVKMLIN